MPGRMDVQFIDREALPTGLGEIGVGAALAKAFHRLTGRRLKHMPLTPARLHEALKA